MESSNDAVTLAVVGILATAVGGLLWIIKYMFSKLLPMIEKSSEASVAAKKATDENTKYLKERNGRDAEVHQRLVKEIKNIPAQITQEVAEQHVSNQQVGAADIKKATIREIAKEAVKQAERKKRKKR